MDRALLVLHFERGIRVRRTGGRCAGRVVTRLERDDVGAVIQRGRGTEGGPVQRQRRAGAVEDLHANVGQPPAAEFCSARTVVLLLSIAVPEKATEALVATVVSQSSS